MTKRKAKTTRINWRKAAVALGSCAVFTLGYSKHLKPGGTMFTRDPKTGKMTFDTWERKFFDALKLIGVEYDEKAYFANASKKGRRR